jgi:hypothetical protein
MDYFDEGIDVSVCKIFADFICHFVFTRLVYTDLSNTFSKVSSFLGNRSHMLNLHKVDQLARDANLTDVEKIRERIPVQNAFDRFVAPIEPMASVPKLQDLDQVLVDFVVRRPSRSKASKIAG